MGKKAKLRRERKIERQLRFYYSRKTPPSEMSVWTFGIGGLIEAWQYASIGDFDWCFDYVWGTLQHEVVVKKQEFKKQLLKEGGYLGRFGEIKKLSCSPQLSPGMLIRDSLILFDAPEQVNLGLSKPVCAGLKSGCSDVIFAHNMLVGISLPELTKLVVKWQNLKFLGSTMGELKELKSTSSLALSNYPLFVTNSPFVLGKLYESGLVSCFLADLLSLVGKDEKTNQLGFLSEIHNWLRACPKTLCIVEENRDRFGIEAQTPYHWHKSYLSLQQELFSQAEDLCAVLGCSFVSLKVEQRISSADLWELVRSKIQD